jgi:ATP-binding protein involved in chromosome partitioning
MFWNKSPEKQQIISALSPYVNSDAVSGLLVQKGNVLITLEINPAELKQMEQAAQDAEAAIKKLKGVKDVKIILTAEKPAEKIQKPAPAEQRTILPHVKDVIAVASGKGGVGKSTVAVNLALSLQKQGLRVGLLDADIYGPSIPMLLGLRDQKPEQENEYLIPLEAHGLKVMSMGFLVKEDAPMVWRGPMVQSALLQMVRDVRWGELDVLLIDMPPGTGDTQLTIAQRIKLSGAVIVSTPQDVALLDTVKGVHMFEKVAVPIFGIVENMSFFNCPHCGNDSDIFGKHGAKQRAAELNVDFLGEVPINIELRMASDQGKPVVLQEDHVITKVFNDISVKITQKIKARSGSRPAPQIVIE